MTLLPPEVPPALAAGLAAVSFGTSGIAAALRVAVGAFLLRSALARPRLGFGRTAGLVGAGLVGAASSLLTMVVGATGPFIAAWVKGLGLAPAARVATHAAMMTVQHGVETVAFGVLGFAFGPWLGLTGRDLDPLGLTALPAGAGFLGTLAGRRVRLRIEAALFARVLSGVPVLLGLNLIRLGLAERL